MNSSWRGDIQVARDALAKRKAIPSRLRHRIVPPKQVNDSFLASVAWAIGIQSQDKPVVFCLQIGLLLLFVCTSIFRRIAGA